MLAVKWGAARLLFRLHLVGSVLLGLSPLLYLPVTVFLMFAIANLSYRFSSIFYQDSGDGRELLGINVVFLTAFIAAFGAMSAIDWALVRVSLLPLFARQKVDVPRRRFMMAGWLLAGLDNLAVWFFWIAVYYAIQFPPSLDFDG
jgi:hypothetical protein